ncbi:iron complex outermembrane receptor protein [Sphingomonas vulcanisoli]|uniref:Iron complex outermembrane receptor protein n=1 Tax=Sphingomonas vulcanisoli TaxID=1658060 RepID=A0ABX0TMI5_9SPHN|nr:TonB-dependent receptor [Sphingomonas vulcanisoli]NIJ06722.1 iron complex outermembrane receptor protein [Sphingomonas vulcanisoli]
MALNSIRIGSSAFALAAALAATAVSAQTTPSNDTTTPSSQAPANVGPAVTDSADLGTIVVTANKRAENVQNVPLAVSVLAPTQLKAAGVTQFSDLGRVSPSLVIRTAEQPVNSNVSLRGVGTFAFGIGVESSVAVLVDEVPLAFAARAFTDLPDVQRIEVLRGPQSTLYGKSASAGLINIITQDPTSTFHAKANALATSDREYGGNVSLSGPMGEDLGYVVSGSYSNWDGNVKNLFNGKRVNGHEAGNFRGKIRWTPDANLKITLSGNYLNGNTTVGRPFTHMSPTALLRNTAGLTEAVVMPGVVVSPDNTDVSNNFNSRTKYQGYGGYLRGELGLGDMTLTSITSYDHFHQTDYLDQDDTSYSGALGNNNQVGEFKEHMVTQEVRLQSPAEKPFRYTIGAYYADVNFARPFVRGPAFSAANWYATIESRQIAGFAQVDWTFLPKLTLTGGVRVQNEKVDYTYQDNLAVAPARSFFSGGAQKTAPTWKVSLRYQITDNLMAFGTYATGYKGQTYDLTTGFNANRAAAGPIRPEKSRDKEVGVRWQSTDHRLTANVTLFSTHYTDLQAQTIETLADGTSNFRLTNVGGLTTKGVEVETSARIGQDVNLRGSVTYLDAKYSSYPVAQCYPLQTAATGCVTTASPTFQNLTGTRAVQAPKWKFQVGADYAPSLTDTLKGVVQVDWQYQSSLFFTPRDPETIQPAYSIVNVGIGVRAADRRWEVIGFVNNLLDKQYYGSLVNTAGNFGNQIATQAVLPRDFHRYGGVRLAFNF